MLMQITYLQWHFLRHFATLTLWGRAEFTITWENRLELLFKTKKCNSFIVNIRGKCYLQACALIFLLSPDATSSQKNSQASQITYYNYDLFQKPF